MLLLLQSPHYLPKSLFLTLKKNNTLSLKKIYILISFHTYLLDRINNLHQIQNELMILCNCLFKNSQICYPTPCYYDDNRNTFTTNLSFNNLSIFPLLGFRANILDYIYTTIPNRANH